MALIDLVRWVPEGNSTIYAWRFPHTNLSTMTQLIVQESQEAILFSKGQIAGKFGPGKHTLSTENLPIIRSLYGLPFGGKNPFTAEVWFVNKVQVYNIDWITDRMTIHDAGYNTMLPLFAYGKYGLKIVDAERFLVKVVGTRSSFSEHDLTEQFTGEFNTKVKSTIMQYMLNGNLGYKQISAHLETMSGYLRDNMAAFWSELGIELTKFYVNTIEIDASTDDGRRIKEAIAKQSEMSITGHTWQQEQMFGTANNAIDGMNSSSTGGLLGGLMAINMMGGMNGGGNMQGMMQPQYNQPTFGGNQQQMGGQMGGQMGDMGQPQQQVRMVHCSNCSNKFPSSMRFCPKCGDPYNPCPKCGTDNDPSSRRCISCGTPLVNEMTLCPNCNNPLAPGSSFCGACGTRVMQSNACSRCNTPTTPGLKFCPVCGNKLG